MKEFKFEVEKKEPVTIDIGGVKYDLPADLDVEEMAYMLKLASLSSKVDDDASNEVYESLAETLLKIKGLFRVYNSEKKVSKLRLTTEQAMEIFQEVYQKNA